jgi:hypothetical protein
MIVALGIIAALSWLVYRTNDEQGGTCEADVHPEPDLYKEVKDMINTNLYANET